MSVFGDWRRGDHFWFEPNFGVLKHIREVIFQLVLHVTVFVFYAYDKKDVILEWDEVAFFSSYALATALISYVYLPRYFYRKKYAAFAVALALTVAAVMVVEELLLEQIFYPDTRGKSFPGVFRTLLGIAPVISILSGFKFAWDALGKQRQVEALKLEVRENELKFLKSQINPHFLFNNLNNLYSYALTHSPKTPDIILELSTVLRYMLYECQEDYVPLKKEIGHLRHYVSLSEMQVEERGKVSFVEENINAGFGIAPLILVVFVENAFKHSTSSQTDGISIDIRIELSDVGELSFDCSNSFERMSNTNHLGQGIGLENVRRRLQLSYPDAHHLLIDNDSGRYRVSLKIDLSKSKML